MTGREPGGEVPWLDEFEPLEEDMSRRQVEGVIELLRPSPKRVADLGCGGGRLLIPLAEDGHELTGVDRRADSIDRCRMRLRERGLDAMLIRMDFFHPASWAAAPFSPDSPFDAILCTGNTIMTVVDVSVMIALMQQVRRHLAADGLFIIDDCPGEFWPLVTDGSWQSGVDESGTLQLIWHPSDTVFSIRQHAEVDDECWELKPDDRCFRLWTDGQLALAAHAAGLSVPHRREGSTLLTFHPAKAR